MDRRSDVKALLARFDDKAAEDGQAPSSRTKTPLAPQPLLWRNMSSVANKAAAFESPSASKYPLNRAGGSFSVKPVPAAEKPAFLKPSALKAQQEGPQREAKDLKPPFPKPSMAGKLPLNAFTAQRDDKEERPPLNKFGLRPTSAAETPPRESEVRDSFPKPSPLSKNLFLVANSPAGGVGVGAGAERPLKPAFLKPTSGPKPWGERAGPVRESAESGRREEGVGARPGGTFPPRPLKPVGEPAKGGEERTGTGTGPAAEAHGTGPKPPAPKSFHPKPKLEDTGVARRFAKPLAQFPVKAPAQESEGEPKDPNAPKRKNLTPLWKLGPPPQKPSRPPNVNLEQFRKVQEKPPPPAPASSRDVGKPPPVPNLSSRLLAVKPVDIIPPTEEDEEENYDDVQGSELVPPPLPPMNPEDRRRQMPSNFGDDKDSSDGEMYEDLDNYRSLKELKEQEKKREKEEKRKQEIDKKEQREKEKREQEMRKRFKFSGPMEVIQTVKVTMDYRGGKNELSCKQGEQLEVIRITDNPEGKWLARTADGNYGHIKVTCVDINYDEIKKKAAIGKPKELAAASQAMRQTLPDQELYDDVAPTSDVTIGGGNNSGGIGGLFPPPPSSEEIYDDVDEIPDDVSPAAQDASKLGSWSWLKRKKMEADAKEGKAKEKEDGDAQGKNSERCLPSIPPSSDIAGGEDVYDDVSTEAFPPPPPEFSLKTEPNKGRKDDADPKRIKKLEKEEKDFRKKFKFDGEIRILGTVQVAQNLMNKKWGNRDLPLKSSEVLDIVQHTDEVKMICRNVDGKFGYVQKVNLATGNAEEDGEIYDDIDTECIYDND